MVPDKSLSRAKALLFVVLRRLQIAVLIAALESESKRPQASGLGNSMKPYYEEAGIAIYHGDCREILPYLSAANCVFADPPYAQTSLVWDVWQSGWVSKVDADSLWVFGTLRMFMDRCSEFAESAWKLSQDVIWEKHNGSNFHNDRFRRVHESAALFYRGNWDDVYHAPRTTSDATKRTIRRKDRPAHMGVIAGSTFTSHDGGPRLLRSVIKVRSCHGEAENETQKPLGIIRPLLEYSCPPGGSMIDPFMGSGSSLVVAKELGLTAIGIEVRESQCEIAARRLSQEVLCFA